MITQNLLPFKIERTDHLLTSRSGLAFLAEVGRAVRLGEAVGEEFPAPGSNRGYQAWDYLQPLVLMLAGGGRHVEDLREIRDDATLRRLVGAETMPSLSTYGDWLERRGRRGAQALVRVNDKIGQKVWSRVGKKDFTLDVDGTVIESGKKEAAWTYKGNRGYQPMVAVLAEPGWILHFEFREGNVPNHTGARRLLRRCLRQCPWIKRLRSDSAWYQGDVIEECQTRRIGYTITADQDLGVKAAIGAVRDWSPLRTEDGELTDREVGTAIHAMRGVRDAFRLIVQRWANPQPSLFEPNEYGYYIIATNRDELTPEQVVWLHNDRGQVENRIKELKIGFGMEQMTSGDFGANAVWFGAGVLAHNLVQAQKLLFLDADWRPKTVATLRWQLWQTAGRLVRHGRELILRLSAVPEKFETLVRMRRRIAAFT